jgi:hypothetical protein
MATSVARYSSNFRDSRPSDGEKLKNGSTDYRLLGNAQSLLTARWNEAKFDYLDVKEMAGYTR